jgi:hypothetical protein
MRIPGADPRRRRDAHQARDRADPAARRPSARSVAPRRFLALIALVRLVPTCWADAAMSRAFGLRQLTVEGR